MPIVEEFEEESSSSDNSSSTSPSVTSSDPWEDSDWKEWDLFFAHDYDDVKIVHPTIPKFLALIILVFIWTIFFLFIVGIIKLL